MYFYNLQDQLREYKNNFRAVRDFRLRIIHTEAIIVKRTFRELYLI